jgi:hypothetical protein
MEVVSWHNNLADNHEVILTKKWWENLRYHHFGGEMCAKFKENPSL